MINHLSTINSFPNQDQFDLPNTNFLLPIDRLAIIADAEEKRNKIRQWMATKGYDAVIISRRENFSWITCGGESHVCHNQSEGVGYVVITEDRHYLIAYSMDLARLMEEQAPDQGYMPISLYWYEGSPAEKALSLLDGKSVAADTFLPGATMVFNELVDLHWPMTGIEIERTRWLAKAMDAVLYRTVKTISPGMSEREIANLIRKFQFDFGIEADTLIVGSDERNYRYRHPLPTDKQVSNYVMLHSAARKWGLHVNLTRCVTFGKPEERLRRIYDAASMIQANVVGMLRPGLKFKEILAAEKDGYKSFGLEDEWQYHYQGGPLGYVVVDAGRCLTEKIVQTNQAYEWFITITGTKVAELSLLTEQGVEIPSLHSPWPRLEIGTPKGVLTLANIFEL